MTVVEMWAKVGQNVMVTANLATEPLLSFILQKIEVIEGQLGKIESIKVRELVSESGQKLSFEWETAAGSFYKTFEVVKDTDLSIKALDSYLEDGREFNLSFKDPRVQIHYRIFESGYNYYGKWYSLGLQVLEILRAIDHEEGPYLRAEAAPYRWELDNNFSSVAVRWVTRDGSFSRLFELRQGSDNGCILVQVDSFVDRHPLISEEMVPLKVQGREEPRIKIARSLTELVSNEAGIFVDFPSLIAKAFQQIESIRGSFTKADAIPLLFSKNGSEWKVWTIILRYWLPDGVWESRNSVRVVGYGETILEYDRFPKKWHE